MNLFWLSHKSLVDEAARYYDLKCNQATDPFELVFFISRIWIFVYKI